MIATVCRLRFFPGHSLSQQHICLKIINTVHAAGVLRATYTAWHNSRRMAPSLTGGSSRHSCLISSRPSNLMSPKPPSRSANQYCQGSQNLANLATTLMKKTTRSLLGPCARASLLAFPGQSWACILISRCGFIGSYSCNRAHEAHA